MSYSDIPIISVVIRKDFDPWTAAVQAAVVFYTQGVPIDIKLAVRRQGDDYDAVAPMYIFALLFQWPSVARNLGANEEPEVFCAEGRVWANETSASGETGWQICLEDWRIQDGHSFGRVVHDVS